RAGWYSKNRSLPRLTEIRSRKSKKSKQQLFRCHCVSVCRSSYQPSRNNSPVEDVLHPSPAAVVGVVGGIRRNGIRNGLGSRVGPHEPHPREHPVERCKCSSHAFFLQVALQVDGKDVID